ncbi:MAG: GNAT family N-acetyltransferase [Thermoflexales bacterium]|nr:GNAT family N-acetyltransferase [Thermoflexales bacterium]
MSSLLRLDNVSDAVAAYYALAHDEKRTNLLLGRDEAGRVSAYVAVCRTGMDLFRPLVVVHEFLPGAAAGLLERALTPGHPYHIIAPLSLASAVNAVLEVDERGLGALYEVRRSSFRPMLNVLVVGTRDSQGRPRFVIRSASGETAAEAGLVWQSDEFAELYVTVQPAARGRGWGRSVVSACTAYVLEAGLRPLYISDPDNSSSVRLCQALGYRDTGVRQYICTGVCKGVQ